MLVIIVLISASRKLARQFAGRDHHSALDAVRGDPDAHLQRVGKSDESRRTGFRLDRGRRGGDGRKRRTTSSRSATCRTALSVPSGQFLKRAWKLVDRWSLPSRIIMIVYLPILSSHRYRRKDVQADGADGRLRAARIAHSQPHLRAGGDDILAAWPRLRKREFPDSLCQSVTIVQRLRYVTQTAQVYRCRRLRLWCC